MGGGDGAWFHYKRRRIGNARETGVDSFSKAFDAAQKTLRLSEVGGLPALLDSNGGAYAYAVPEVIAMMSGVGCDNVDARLSVARALRKTQDKAAIVSAGGMVALHQWLKEGRERCINSRASQDGDIFEILCCLDQMPLSSTALRDSHIGQVVMPLRWLGSIAIEGVASKLIHRWAAQLKRDPPKVQAPQADDRMPEHQPQPQLKRESQPQQRQQPQPAQQQHVREATMSSKSVALPQGAGVSVKAAVESHVGCSEPDLEPAAVCRPTESEESWKAKREVENAKREVESEHDREVEETVRELQALGEVLRQHAIEAKFKPDIITDIWANAIDARSQPQSPNVSPKPAIRRGIASPQRSTPSPQPSTASSSQSSLASSASDSDSDPDSQSPCRPLSLLYAEYFEPIVIGD